MKNQYFGDINDYRKYGLLRGLQKETGLRFGVSWMLTEPDLRSDGRRTEYWANPFRWREFDPALFDLLRQCEEHPSLRDVSSAQNWELIDNATYYTGLLEDGEASRRLYFREAWRILASCEVVFFDP